MGSKRNRQAREARRELHRDEVVAPEIGGVLGEWQRDMGYMRYRLVRRLGPFGPIVVAVIVIGIIAGIVLRFI